MIRAASCFLLGAIGLAGCFQPYVAPTTTSALVAGAVTSTKGPPSQAEVSDSIAEVRCDREARCNKIGEGHYGNVQSCVMDMRSRARQRVATAPCSGTVDRAKLDACTAALGAERCDDTFDGFDTLLECQTLCGR